MGESLQAVLGGWEIQIQLPGRRRSTSAEGMGVVLEPRGDCYPHTCPCATHPSTERWLPLSMERLRAGCGSHGPEFRSDPELPPGFLQDPVAGRMK